MSDQFPLDLAHKPSQEAADYIRTSANEAAFQHVLGWAGGQAAPALGLVGPPGCGKSHLAHLWAERSGAQVITGKGTPIDPAMARPLCLLEDIDQIHVDEEWLFHLFNAVKTAGGALLMTARTVPSQWHLRLPDLVSRVKSVAIAKIDQPDDTLLQLLLAKLFADRQISVDPSVLAFAATRMERSYTAVFQLVERADKKALAEKRAVTLPLIRSCLDEVE